MKNNLEIGLNYRDRALLKTSKRFLKPPPSLFKKRMCAEIDMSVRRALPLVIANTISSKADTTVYSHRLALQHFTNFSALKYPVRNSNDALFLLFTSNKATGNTILTRFKEFLLQHKKPRYSAVTVNKYLGCLLNFVSAANLLGVISWKAEVKMLPVRNTGLAKYIPETDEFFMMLDLLKSRKNESLEALRDYTILLLSFGLALRMGEVAALYRQNLDFNRKILKVKDKMYINSMTMDLPLELVTALKEYIEVRGNHPGPLFYKQAAQRASKPTAIFAQSGLIKMIKTTAMEAGLFDTIKNPMSFHSVRRCAISRAAQIASKNGQGLDAVLPFSRHADIRTLMIYLRKIREAQKNFSSFVLERESND